MNLIQKLKAKYGDQPFLDEVVGEGGRELTQLPIRSITLDCMGVGRLGRRYYYDGHLIHQLIKYGSLFFIFCFLVTFAYVGIELLKI